MKKPGGKGKIVRRRARRTSLSDERVPEPTPKPASSSGEREPERASLAASSGVAGEAADKIIGDWQNEAQTANADHLRHATPAAAAGSRWTYSHRGYALAQAFRQLLQRKLSSMSTLLVLGITLALPVTLLFAASSLQSLGQHSVDGESLTLYLSTTLSDLDGATLANDLTRRPGVRDTRYISRDEALATFRAESDIGPALEALGSNPLPGAIMVFPDSNTLDATRIRRLADTLQRLPEVERVQLDLRWVKRLKAVLELVRLLGWLLAGFLTLTALLVIGNTIRLELTRRQKELKVCNLLGASPTFMRRPFLYSGALYGFLGGAVACLVALITLQLLRQPADELSSLYASAYRLEMPTSSQFLTVLLAATVLGLVGAAITLFRPSRQRMTFPKS